MLPVADVPEIEGVGMTVPGQRELPAAGRRDHDLRGVDFPRPGVGRPGRGHHGLRGAERYPEAAIAQAPRAGYEPGLGSSSATFSAISSKDRIRSEMS